MSYVPYQTHSPPEHGRGFCGQKPERFDPATAGLLACHPNNRLMPVTGIYACPVEGIDRSLQIGVASGKLISVEFPETPPADATKTHDLLDRFTAYFEGTEDDFRDVEIGLTIPTDRRTVLQTLRKVPYGQSVTVERLTAMTPGLDAEETADQDTVRTALRENPLPVVCPDHRVRDGPSAAPASVAARLRQTEDLP